MLLFGVSHTNAQTIQFDAPAEVCLNENATLNNSSDSVAHHWDFCLEEFLNQPTENSLGTLSNVTRVRGSSMVKDSTTGTYFLFASDDSKNDLNRIILGDSLGFSYVHQKVTFSSGSLSSPHDISVIKNSDGDWYGFIGSATSGVGVKRINFGNSLLNNNLVITDLGTFGEGNIQIRDVKIWKEGANYYLVGLNLNNNRFVVVDYGNSLLNTPLDTLVTSSITGMNGANGFDLVEYDGDVLAFVVGLTSKNIIRVNFGSSIHNNCSVENTFDNTDFPSTIDRLSRIKIVENYGKYYAILNQFDAGFSTLTIDLKNLNNDSIPTDLGHSNTQLNDIAGGYYNGNYYFYGVSGANLIRVGYISDCGQSINTSNEYNPLISYDQSGTNVIGLKITSVASSFLSDTLVVSASEAPDIDFTVDDNICSDNQNSFTSQNLSGNISTYQWIFDEDTLVASTFPDTVYQFSPGLHQITLFVSSEEGCTNQVTKTIEIYPPLPVPSFESIGTLCSGTGISFNNTTDLSAYNGLVEFIWDFNGEGSSNAEDTVFTFSSSGTKTIQLSLRIPGCEEMTSEVLDLGVGPEVDFSWTNNCFGENVVFINQTTGSGIVNYLWDFDNGAYSNQEDTTVLFEMAGEYQVSLTVTNDQGCETTKTKTLDVSDQPIASIEIGEVIENVVFPIKGLDHTGDSDSISSWNWEFAGLGNSVLQDTVFTFTEPAQYEIELTVLSSQGCSEVVNNFVNVIESTEPNIDFQFYSDTLCLDESLGINNSTANAISYEWDFCGQEFLNPPSITNVSTNPSISQIRGMVIERDEENYIGLATDGVTGKLWRLYFGDSLGSQVLFEEIEGMGLTSPAGISLYEEDGIWYGIIGSSQSGYGLTLLNFGESLLNDPTPEALGTLGLGNTQIRDAKFRKTNMGTILVAADLSNEKLIRILYPDGISNAPSDTIISLPIGSTSNIAGLDLIKRGNEWVGFVTSLDGTNMVRVSFGNSLMNELTIEQSFSFASFNRPSRIRIIPSSGQYYGLVSNFNSGLSLLDLKDLNSEPVEIEMSTSQFYTTDGEYYQGNFNSYAFNGNILTRIRFGSDCGESMPISSIKDPQPFYSIDGEYVITLKAIHENESYVYAVDTITVTASTAPDIAFSISSNQCLSNTNTFTSTNTSGNITAYSWDFDGDGVEDSTGPNPMYQFAEAGTYEVRLSVESDEGCGNFAQENITIYPEPPVPVFTVPKDSFCVGEPVIISNLTNDAAWDGIVEYTWSVTDLTDTTTAAPELTFDQPGEKVIRVISQIPGCESVEVTDTIQVIESPVVDFTADPVCDGETTILSNNSEAGMILWDFGDGITSTDQNPTHTFATPNTYSVSLSVTNDLECTTTLVKEVAVNAIPQANFQYDLVCAGSESAFEDMSVVEQADISAWQWFVDGELVSEEQFPVIAFPEARDFTVRLIAGSTKGCESFYEEVVAVGAAPNTGIGIDLGCLGEPTVFSDLTNPVEVLTRSWMIDGQPYNTTAPAVTFNEPGTYEVELTVTNNQLCSSIVTETFTIYELPVADFTISGQCNNEIILLEDASTSTSDPISVRQWYIDGSLLGEGANVSLSGYPPGNYDFTLEVTTENGCVVSTQQTFEIAETPEASFTASNDYGVPPFRLDFSNTSQMASVNEWYVNDALITTNPSPSIVFNDSGSQLVRLITYNSTGCADTAEMIINAIEPVVDLAVTSVQLVEDGNNYDIVLDVKNASNLPIEAMSVNVELQNQFSVSEQVYQRINSGEESIVMLGTSIPKSTNGPAYLCISIFSAYEEPIPNLKDNEACITIEQKISFEPPYPNPASSETSLRYILPEGGDATIEVFDVSGSIEISENYEDLPKGLNQFILDVSTLDAGTYLIKFRYNGSVIVSKIIKL
ncbi:MAG: PKD domain-containing protein [Cyclobacteriaceae bacterium]